MLSLAAQVVTHDQQVTQREDLWFAQASKPMCLLGFRFFSRAAFEQILELLEQHVVQAIGVDFDNEATIELRDRQILRRLNLGDGLDFDTSAGPFPRHPEPVQTPI